MPKTTKKSEISVTNTDVRIGIGFELSLLLVYFFPSIQALSAGTAVIMCTQDSGKFTWKAGLTRLEGVLIGGVCAVLIVLLDNWIGNQFVFIALCGIGIVLNLVCCRAAKMPAIAAKVSCITFVLVTLVLQGEARLKYALLRVLGTAVGALVALLISWIYDKCFSRKEAGI